MARRFGGLERLYGVAGAARIRDAHLMVVGIGGVGSWAVEALARSGVGKLTLVDLDHISESHINPDCRVLAIDDFVEPDNWAAMLARAVDAHGPLNAVIDACDEVRAKLA